jgi:hypothetical protein
MINRERTSQRMQHYFSIQLLKLDQPIMSQFLREELNGTAVM